MESQNNRKWSWKRCERSLIPGPYLPRHNEQTKESVPLLRVVRIQQGYRCPLLQYSHTGHASWLCSGIRIEEYVNRGNWLRPYGASPLSNDTTSVLPLVWAGFATTLPYCHPHVTAKSVAPTIVCLRVKNFSANPSWKYSAAYYRFQLLPQHLGVKHIWIATTHPEVTDSLFQPVKPNREQTLTQS